MSRAFLILANDEVRQRAARWAHKLPTGTRVEFKAPRRTLEQNAKFWAALTDISTQVKHAGQHYTPDQWKALFLHAIGREVKFLPALEGGGFVPYGQSSSDLSKEEMSELLEFILAWGAQNGVVFKDEVAA